MRIKCLLSSAPSRDKCLSHQGELKALIRQLQTAHHMKAGTQGLANTLCFIPGRVALVCRAACPLRGERRGGGRLFYSHVYTFYTLIFSDRHPNYPRASGSALLHEGCYEGCCEGPRAAATLEALQKGMAQVTSGSGWQPSRLRDVFLGQGGEFSSSVLRRRKLDRASCCPPAWTTALCCSRTTSALGTGQVPCPCLGLVPEPGNGRLR